MGEEKMENFGGPERIRKLAELLSALQGAGVKLYILSTGFKHIFGPLLQAVGLRDFFPDKQMFGQVEQVERTGGCVKGEFIKLVMAECGWTYEDVLFIDDSHKNIVSAVQVCRTYHIPQPKEFGKH